MVRKFPHAIILSLILIHQASCLQLLANYKLWKSIGDQLVYDYSTNTRHGKLNSNYLATDRGLAPYSSYNLLFMNYAFIPQNDYAISFWVLNRYEDSNFELTFYLSFGGFYVLYDTSSDPNAYMINIYDDGGTQIYDNITGFEGWNLHTVSISIDSSINYKITINLYLNLSHIYLSSVDIIPNVKVFNIHFNHQDANANTGSILYEMWIHTGLLNISELSSLISTSSSCVCSYNCPTSPSIVCLPTFSKSESNLGQLCPSSCIDNMQSCHSDLSCIPKFKAECKLRLYDKATSDCLFFCPGNSCNCSTVTDSITKMRSYLCSCKAGYKRISSDPPACISNRCLTHHPEGYRHICDVTEVGYILDATGDCCICAPNYTQVSSNPIVCIYIPHCLSYILSSGSYICSSCALAYKVDSLGNCNECDTNYTIVQINPFTCSTGIERCISYFYDGVSLKCQKCSVGYTVDSQGYCNECDSGHISLSVSSFTCSKTVSRCIEHVYDGAEAACKSCIQGYYPSNSGLECIPRNCLAYEIVLDDYMCLECSKGYQIDSDRKCNLCEASYDTVLNDPFTCTPKIENCLSYKQSGEEFICEMCSIGYKLSTSGLCDECDANYSRVEPESSMCEPDILNCLDHEISEETVKCISCDEGYSIDLDYECKDCDAGYIKLSQESSICIKEVYNCSNYGLYQRKWVCTECSLGYELDENKECNLCAPGYTYSENSKSKCILMPDSSESSGNSDNQEEDSVQNQRGDLLESSNSIVATVTFASNSVSSMISYDTETLTLYINSIQLLSLIQFLNLNLPYELKKQQSSTFKYIKKINILTYMKIQNKELSGYIESISDYHPSFLAQVIYHIILLIAIFILNAGIYYISKYGKGKLKEYANKMLRYFKYSIYFLICSITYLDIAYSSYSKILHPRDDSDLSILDYDLALLVSIFLALYSLLLASLLKSITLELDQNSSLEKYGVLIKNYKSSLICLYYHEFFYIRRLAIAASIHLLHDLPYIQVMVHVILARPFKDAVLNGFMILVEICIFICYLCSGFFLISDIDPEILMWFIIGGIYICYLLHSVLSYYKIFAILYPVIRRCFTSRSLENASSASIALKEQERYN